jgi:hypothetical protein
MAFASVKAISCTAVEPASRVTGDRDRVPVRNVRRAVLEDVGDDPHRRTGRIHVGAAGDVLLEQVVLDRATDVRARHTVLLGDELVHQEEDRGRRVDRHRRRDLVERQVGEQQPHVGHRVDRDTDLADLALRPAVVGVVPHLRRQIERTGQAGLTGIEQELEALVGRLGVTEARVLAHRPEPTGVHRRVDAAGVRR